MQAWIQIACAALDGTGWGPIPAGHELLTLPNGLVVPYIASVSWAARTRLAATVAENLLAGLVGEPLPNGADPAIFGGP